MYSDRMIDVAFGDHEWEHILSALRQGQTLSAEGFLAALEGESEETLAQALDHLEHAGVELDTSCLSFGDGHSESALRLRREAQLVKSGSLMTALEEGDPLRLYLEELAGLPAFGDLDALALELAEANVQGRDEPELWNQILNLSLSRVVEIACGYTGKGVLLLDLIQDGSLGLWSDLCRYEGGSIRDFLDCTIHRNMVRSILTQARSSGVGQKMCRAMEDYRSVDQRLLGELGRNPTLEELAEAMHTDVRTAAVIGEMVSAARNINRLKAEPEQEETPEEGNLAVEDTAYFQMRQRISELLSGLSEQDAKLLILRYGLEGGLPMSTEATGRQLGLTPEEVEAREAAAMGKLRQQG